MLPCSFPFRIFSSSYIKQFNLNLCSGPACIPHCSKAQCAATQRAGSFLSGGQLTSRLAVCVISWPACCATGSNSHLLNRNMLDRKECWIFFLCRCPHVLMEIWITQNLWMRICDSVLHVCENEVYIKQIRKHIYPYKIKSECKTAMDWERMIK